MSAATGDGLREVRILDFPLDVSNRATEAFEGLRREFALVAMQTPEGGNVPARLLELVEALTREYAGISDQADQQRADAVERGDASIPELVHRVPTGVAGACIQLNGMLDEADEFCRQGDLLLNLATPPEAVAFRRWYLGEFVAQINGEAPVPWSAVDQDALARDRRLRGT